MTVDVTSDLVIPIGATEVFGADGQRWNPTYLLIAGYVPGDTRTLTVEGAIQIASSDAGSILVGFSGASATYDFSNIVIDVTATGSVSIDASGSGAWAYGYNSSFTVAGHVDNDGTIAVSAASEAWGAALNSGVELGFVNRGSLSVSASNLAVGIDIDQLSHGGSVDNYGSITASGGSAIGVDIIQQGDLFHNHGSITVTGTTAYGIAVEPTSTLADNILNTGTITATDAVIAVSGQLWSAPIVLTNSGVINGQILLGTGPGLHPNPGFPTGSTISNSGAINGAVHLSATGADIYDGRGGTLSGGLYLGGAHDTVYLGDDGETVHGGTGTATILGGAGADTITGDSGADIIDGGGGSDTLTGGLGADVFAFTTATGSVVVTDFSQAQGDKVDLSALLLFNSFAEVQAAAVQSGPDTVVGLGGGHTITLQNVQLTDLTSADFLLGPIPVDGNYVQPAGQTLSFEANAPAYRLTDQPVQNASLTIAGSVSQSSSAANTSVATITDTGLNPGDQDTVHITSGGALSVNLTGAGSSATGYLSASSAASPAIVNDGLFDIEATHQAIGLSLAGAASFANTDGFQVAGDDAIGIAGFDAPGSWGATYAYEGFQGASGPMSNDGTFTVTGGTSALGIFAGDGTFTNSGTLTVTASNGAAIGIDVQIASHLTLNNSGTITAQTAILVDSGFVSLNNDGTINGDIVVRGSGSASIVNTGTINGGLTLLQSETVDSHAGSMSGPVTVGGGHETISLGAEDNTVLFASGGPASSGIHDVDGGGGINTASYAAASQDVTVSLDVQGFQNTINSNGADSLSHFQNLVGSSFGDTLTGSAGASTLTGGLGADTLKIASSAADTTITDFSHAQGDKIDLTALPEFSSFADVQAAAVQVGADTVIHTDSGSITLDNVNLGDLTPPDVAVSTSLPYPYDCVCYISDTIGGVNYRASGVIVGPHTILTAAHVVWSADNGGQSATNIVIYPGLSSTYSVSVHAAAIHYNPVDDANDLISQSESQNDFAVIDVAQNLTNYGWFGIAVDFTGGTGGIAGYPAANGHTQQDTTGSLSKDPHYNLVDYSAAFNVSGGSSGGPIWINQWSAQSPLPYVVGLVSTASWGAEITSADLTQIKNWVAQDTGYWVDSPGDMTGSGFDDHLIGDSGDNTIDGMGGDDVMDGGAGTNTVSFASASTGVNVSLMLQGQAQNTGATTDTLTNFQNVTGSAFNDTLEGDGNNNVLNGGGGINTVSYAHATAGVTVSLASQGTAQNTVGAGTDTLSNFTNLTGSSFADHLTGDANANVIRGGGGSDVMAGGGGADTFVLGGGASALTITDFSYAQGDRIDLTADGGGLHNLAELLASAVQSGANTVINLGGGASLTLDNVAGLSLQASDFIGLVTVLDNFGGGSFSNVLFRDTATGDWGYMSANPSGGETWHPIGSSSTDYAPIAKGDFNGDGVLDTAFLQVSTGSWGFLTINPGGGETWHAAGSASLAYGAVAAQDFNGDGSTDIAFRDPVGGDWGYMSATPSGSETWHPIGTSSPDYAVMGSGDFNGDAFKDVAFRQISTGDWGFMTPNPSGGQTWHAVGTSTLSYEAIATGDFNGDGLTDILFRNPVSGDWGYMSVNASGQTWHAIGSSAPDYAFLAIGDFNGDGVPDAAFRQTSTGEWGYLSINHGGGETWHYVGSTSMDYMSV